MHAKVFTAPAKSVTITAMVASVFLAMAMTLAGPRAAAAPDPAPIIELYTMGPGPSLFSKFGHAAICVRYSRKLSDRCYNYGTTNFAEPVHLVWGVLRSDSVFWVSVDSPARMIRHYERRDRSVWRQTIPLAPAAARALAARLAEAALPENRTYSYHHYHDNCSTRVRDLLDEATGGALSRGRKDAPFSATYRELSRRGLAGAPWLVALSDIVLGGAADETPDVYQAMFLPAVLRAEVATRLGVEPEVIYAHAGPPPPELDGAMRAWWWAALAVVCTAFALGARLLVARGARRGRRLALVAAFLPIGIIGLLLWGVALVSPLPELRFNEAVLVFWPLDLAVPFVSEHLARRYARGRIAILVVVSLLVVIGVFSQPLLLPILAAGIPAATLL